MNEGMSGAPNRHVRSSQHVTYTYKLHSLGSPGAWKVAGLAGGALAGGERVLTQIQVP